MSEFITIFLAVLGVIIAYQSLKGDTKEREDNFTEGRTILIEKFDLLDRMNAELVEVLNFYGTSNNAFEKIYIQHLTLNQCIGILNDVRTQILTTENRRVMQETPSKQRIDNLTKHLETQILHHSEMLTHYKLFVLPTLQ